MKLVSLDKRRSTQLFFTIALVVMAVLFLTAKQDDPGVVVASLILALISIYPLYFWLLGWSHGLPIWPVFVASNGIAAAFPMMQEAKSLATYTPDEIIVGAFTYIGFFVLGTAIWLVLTARAKNPPKNVLMISRSHSERVLFAFVVFGLLFYLNQVGGLVSLPGNTMQIVRGISSSLSTLGIFVLAFYDGRGLLSGTQSVWLAVLAALTAFAGAAGLIMATAIVPVAMLLLGYTLGGAKMPWRSLAVAAAIAAVLHPGKFAMRDLYWGPDRPAFTLATLPQFYMDWFGLGLEQVGSMVGLSKSIAQEEVQTSMFERSGSLHMLLLTQKKSPGEVPFLNGLTYAPIPRLLIPRFLDDNKGISHAGNVLLSVNYGLQTIEGTRNTSIGWGLVPEAYANFGYLGVAALGIAAAVFYSFFTNLSSSVPMTSLRFVLGLLIMAAATRADTMGVFITTQFQGIVSVTLAALFLMQRQPNPFAEEQELEAQSGKAGRWAGGKREAWSGETGAREETGKVSRWENKKVGEGGRDTASAGPRDVGTGGTVRTMPTQTPKRISRWMPRRMRAAVVAARGAGEEQTESVSAEQQDGGQKKTEEEGKERPRQLAVPYQNYRRYRG